LIKLLVLAIALAADPEPGQVRRANANIQQLLLGKAIVREAKRHAGEPYVWGGKEIQKDGGLDCSGFTSTVFKTFGIDLPVSAMEQYRGGFAIERPALGPGDLVFFLSSSGQTPMHVGIYLGGGEFIHAPGSGKLIGTESLSKGYFALRYVGARRYQPAPKPPSTATATRETKP